MNQWFCYVDLVTKFVAVILSQSESLGKMALGIVEIYLGSLFSSNRGCSRSACRGPINMSTNNCFELIQCSILCWFIDMYEVCPKSNETFFTRTFIHN